MDTIIMVINKSDIDINSAKNLLISMDKKNISPKSFLWYFHDDYWRLIISSNKFKEHSINDNYSIFIKDFKNDENLKRIGLQNITLVDPDDDLIKLFRSAIKTDPKSISEIRFKSSVINNFYIDDAVIYRLT